MLLWHIFRVGIKRAMLKAGTDSTCRPHTRCWLTLAVELHSGRGFFVLRGLDPKLYTGEQNAIIFVGISSYIGETRGRQDREGKMLGGYCKSSVVGSLLITFRSHS